MMGWITQSHFRLQWFVHLDVRLQWYVTKNESDTGLVFNRSVNAWPQLSFLSYPTLLYPTSPSTIFSKSLIVKLSRPLNIQSVLAPRAVPVSNPALSCI